MKGGYMKRTAISALFLPVVVLAGIYCAKESKTDARVSVLSAIGAVSLNTPGAPLKPGDTLGAGDRVITGKNSLAELRLASNSALRIYENTEFMITKNELDPAGGIGNAQMDVRKGKTLLLFGKLARDSSVKVKTPTAVASVRGTSFIVDVKEESGKSKGTTTLKVIDGKVRVEAGKKPEENRVVEQGERIVLDQERVVEERKPIPARELKELKKEEEKLSEKIIEAPAEAKKEEPKQIEPLKPPVLKTEKAIRDYYKKLEIINLDDGSTLVGAVIFQNQQVVRIHTTNGVVQVPTYSVKNVVMKRI